MKKRRKKYKRPYPNNPKKEVLDKKIPFNRSVRRSVVIEFERVCDDLGVSPSPMTEELLINFINSVKK